MKLNILLDKETWIWFQRAKALWATHKHKNSKYFHSRTAQKRRKNSILKIRNSPRQWCTNLDDIATIVLGYESLQFWANPTTWRHTQIYSWYHKCRYEQPTFITFYGLGSPGSNKTEAPPPLKRQDLMICLFYQNYCNLIGKDISQLVLHFLNLASLPPHLNHTFVTFIPKVKCLELVSEYRPISLCNVLYKSFQRF